jgi:hypothetical protein
MTKTINVEAVEISGVPALDPIQVFWSDLEPGKGSVTITCFGAAWTAYFGAMGENTTIRDFFARADTGYLVIKLGITPLLKCRKADYAYLGRIIDAVKASLTEGVPA